MMSSVPFILVGYRGDEFFCAHEEETEKLLGRIRKDSDEPLMVPRRLGETGRLHPVSAMLRRAA